MTETNPAAAELMAQLEAMDDWRAILDGELADMAATTKRINALGRRPGGRAPRVSAAPAPLGTASRGDQSPVVPSRATYAPALRPASSVIPAAASNPICLGCRLPESHCACGTL